MASPKSQFDVARLIAVAGREGHAATVDRLDALSRTRALSDAESRQLEHAYREAMRPASHVGRRIERLTQPWTEADDLRLAKMIVGGMRPPQIGVAMNRTERAIWRRMYKLGGRAKVVAMGSIALTRRDK